MQCTCEKECSNPLCDKRKLGLMKMENRSSCAIALSSKTHTECESDPLDGDGGIKHFIKTSAKGMPGKCLPVDTFSMFRRVLEKEEGFSCTMDTFQRDAKLKQVVRRRTTRQGITSKYNNKRKLLEDGVHTKGIGVEVFAGSPKKMKGIFTEEHYVSREERVQRNVRAIFGSHSNDQE